MFNVNSILVADSQRQQLSVALLEKNLLSDTQFTPADRHRLLKEYIQLLVRGAP